MVIELHASALERGFFRLAQRVAGPRLDLHRAAAYWERPQGDPGGLVYVALGDSVAQGVGASTPAAGYVGLLATRLREATGGPVQVVNLSVSGARVVDVLKQVEVLPRCDLVTLDIGGNDVRHYHPDRFAEQLSELCGVLPAGTVVADLPYFMHGHWERDALAAGEVVEREAALRNLTVVPVHATMAARGWHGMFRDYAPDFFHPNDRGHRLWAQAFWPSVAAALTLPV